MISPLYTRRNLLGYEEIRGNERHCCLSLLHKLMSLSIAFFQKPQYRVIDEYRVFSYHMGLMTVSWHN